jgi:putative tricarboxylic transport membrane protein
MVKNERRAGLFFILLGVAVIFYSFNALSLGTVKEPGPGFFPFISGVCVVVFSIVWILGLKKEAAEEDKPFWEKGQWVRPLYAILITCVYAGVMDRLGYVLSTLLFIIAWQLFIEGGKWKKIVIISIVGTIVMYILFQYLLSVPLPEGLFSI